MTEKDSIVNKKAIIGRTKTESVRKATTVKAVLKPKMPVSPITNLAGGILNQRKPKREPRTTAQKLAKLIWPRQRAMMAKALKIEAKAPPERPSKPSITPPE